MRTPGMIRKVDELGRIVIPSELRKALEVGPGDAMELYLQEDRLVLKKFAPACIFCGGIQGLMTYEGKNICRKCIDTISRA